MATATVMAIRMTAAMKAMAMDTETVTGTISKSEVEHVRAASDGRPCSLMERVGKVRAFGLVCDDADAGGCGDFCCE
jgi:hypothetical protein